MIYWLARYVLLGPLLKMRVRARVTGIDNLPPKNVPYVVAVGSHVSEVESGALVVYWPDRQLHFLAKQKYWNKKWLGWLLTKFGAIKIDRHSIGSSTAAIVTGAKILHDGGVLAIFPEGTRSPDGKVHAGKAAVIDAIVRSNRDIVVVPVGLVGFESYASDGIWPRRRHEVEIKIGKHIPLSNFGLSMAEEIRKIGHQNQGGGGVLIEPYNRRQQFVLSALSRLATPPVMHEIAELCGKEYSKKPLKLNLD